MKICEGKDLTTHDKIRFYSDRCPLCSLKLSSLNKDKKIKNLTDALEQSIEERLYLRNQLRSYKNGHSVAWA